LGDRIERLFNIISKVFALLFGGRMNKFMKLTAVAALALSTTSLSLPMLAAEEDETIREQMFTMQQQLLSLTGKVDKQSKLISKQKYELAFQKKQIDKHNTLLADQQANLTLQEEAIIEQDAGLQRQNKVIEEQANLLLNGKFELDQQASLINDVLAEQLAGISPASGDELADNFKIEFKPSPKISSADGRFSFQPFGRVHMDYTFFNDDVRDNADNANFRRASLGFNGKVDNDWKYTFEVDFAGDATNLKAAYLGYTGIDGYELRAGHFKPALGFGENTSSNYIQFIERSAPTNTFITGRKLGLGLFTGGDNWSFAGGVFNDDAGVDSSDDEAVSFDLGASFAPINEAGKVLHLGVAGSLRYPDAAADSVRFRARPETGKGTRFVDTGTIANVDSVTVYGLELAGVMDSATFQGEYFKTDVDLNSGSNDPSFSGWYAQATYLVTGEQRKYDAKSGQFKRIKPKTPFKFGVDGATGAVEIALRYSNTDLNDAGAGVLGGEMDNFTVGVNWYINNNVRLMTNYVSVETDSNAAVGNADTDIVEVRAAIDF
jgi:phosphate-selective porin OprO/OprP